MRRSANPAPADFDAKIAAEAAHIADDGVARLQRPQPLESSPTELLRPIDQLFVLDHVQRRQRGSRGDRALFVGVVAERGFRGRNRAGLRR